MQTNMSKSVYYVCIIAWYDRQGKGQQGFRNRFDCLYLQPVH